MSAVCNLPGMNAPDPITAELFRNAIVALGDEMALTIYRAAYSGVLKNIMDYSTAICDAEGRLVAQGLSLPGHLCSIPVALQSCIRHFGADIHPGDVLAMNDPYDGGMHLPDIFVFRPVFAEGAVLAWAATICHHTDVGGRVPGSNASDSTEIFQEGLRIPPIKLYDRGVPNRTLLALIATNVRLPDLVLGDLDAQFATCAIGERELAALHARHGDALEACFDRLLDYGEALTRKAIAAWPDGDYAFTDFIDGDGFSPDPIPIACRITVAGDRLAVDFAGSSPQVKGAINSTFSFVKSATYLAIRCALDHEVPNNAGVYRCIAVSAPEGSILNPRPPAAVAARALTGYRVVDTVLGALAQVAPARLMAAGEGGNTVVAIGGYQGERPFVLVDMINGAWGGRDGKDGIEGVTNPSQNMSNLPVETLEARYPLRVEEYALRPDSGGAGRWRGGLGLVRQYRLLADRAVLQLRSDRTWHAPWGLFGGRSGAPSRSLVDRGAGWEPLPGKATLEITAGTVIRHEQAGAGGWGDPAGRDAAAVAADLADGKISPERAEADYGARA